MRSRDFFAGHPVFTYREFASALASRGRSNRTPDSLLTYYVQTGRLVRVRRGLYASIPTGAAPDECPVDPYLVAAKLTEDAVLAYHTALGFHGNAYSARWELFYLTGRRSRPLAFRDNHFRSVPFPKALRERHQEGFGVLVAERTGLDVRVTSLERTLVDVLDRPDLAGGWEEIWRSLESVEFFDIDRVVEYALLLQNGTTAAKVGLYLDQHREPLMVEDAHLDRLKERRPRTPHYLVRASRKTGRLVKDWNLVVPAYVLERSWEEVG